MWFSIDATEQESSRPLDACRRASVVASIGPSAPRLAKRNARIDVTIEASPGRGRQTLTIKCVRAVAENADTPALDTIGIIDRGCRTGAGYRGGTGRRQNQRD